MERIDSYYDYLYVAQQRNFTRWDILGQLTWPNYYYGETYEDEVNLLKDWITDRLVWLDDNMPGNCHAYSVELINHNGQNQLTLFPNPAKNNMVWIKIPTCSGLAELSVFNIVGQKILMQHISKSNISKLKELDVSGYKNGVYIVRVTDFKNTWYQKLIVE